MGRPQKPGQLSWGSGSTPTFFGPNTGGDYLTLIDNADNKVNLMVVRVANGGLVCKTPVLTSGGPGSENSPIGAGRTVIAASTYGYPYPAVPDDAGPAVPPTAPFTGGMTRVDVRADGTGCDVIWDSAVRSAAVPKLSLADARSPPSPGVTRWATSRKPGFSTSTSTPWSTRRPVRCGRSSSSAQRPRWTRSRPRARPRPDGCSTRAPSPALCASCRSTDAR